MLTRTFARQAFRLTGILTLCTLHALTSIYLRADTCTPPPSGLIAWWPGNGSANDAIGTNSGALQNLATFVPGRAGLGFGLNGTSDYVLATRSPLWAFGTNSFTLELWANFAASGNRVLLASDGGSGSNNKWIFWVTAGNLQLHINDTTGVAVNLGTAPFSPTFGQWYHLAVTRTNSTYTFYINGTAAATNTTTRVIPDSGAPLTIGSAENNYFFSGALDEVSIYNRALAPSEIQAIFTAATAGKCGAPSFGATVPYFTDFENSIGSEWSVPVINSSELAGFTRFTGRFDNTAQALTVTNLVPGQAYTLGFDFYALDAWNGNGNNMFLNVQLNGTQVFHQTFANYNGNPPNNTQTYPGQPDEGRANFGFTPSYVDSIYRNIEISFTATNAITSFSFSGQNLQAVDSESWGLDNVGLRLTSSITNTFIRSTSLPPAGTTNSVPIENFTISANYPLQAASAVNTASYVLREAGADGILGNGDDVIYAITPSLPGQGGRSVSFAVPNAPLQPGRYRFQTTSSLLGTNSSPVSVFSQDFVIAQPVLGRIETSGNDALATASPLPTTESPVGSGFYTAFAVGTFASTSDVDYWRFDAEAGDIVTVRLEAESQGVYPQVYLQNASAQNISTAGGDYSGVVAIPNVTISTPGTYYLRVFSNNNRSRYRMRLDQSRGPQMESESNDSQATANPVNLTFTPGLYQGRMVGALPAADTSGDFFKLGTLNVGNAISVNALFPAGSALSSTQTVLSVQVNGNPVALVTNTTGNLNYTVVSNGIHYIHVETSNPDLRSQYLLNISIVDGVPPVITAASLPAEGTTSTAIIDRLTLNFSEDINQLSISNSANYELRGAGPNGIMGDADDTFYNVAIGSSGYTGGLVAVYSITDGPLQPGNYRFTVRTNLIDRANNPMSAPFVRNFTVANLPGFVIENRNNDSTGLGTSLSLSPGVNSDGTIGFVSSTGTGANPQAIAAGVLNNDTNIDLVTANWNAGGITVLTNNGAGVFSLATNIATGNNPVGVTLGDFNNDTKMDIAVANFSSGTVSILTNNGSGGFVLRTNISGFSQPYNLIAGDFNHDNKLDLAVPNYGNGTITVLLGNGDGTFQVSSNYATGSNPQAIAMGDVNNDNKVDLAVANYSSSTVTLLLGNGDGTFHTLTNLSTGPNPRRVAIADVTGDGIPDLVTLQPGDNSVSVLAGNNDGTFQARRFFYNGTSDAYDFAVVDMNGDGFKDIVVPGYGNNQVGVLLNNGTGYFTNLYNYGVGQNPIGIAVGDFNGDGRTDVAFCHYNGADITVWAGNAASQLVEDPPGSGLRTVFARGTRTSSTDVDYYQFSGNAGDQVILAADVPGNPSASSLNYAIVRLDGSVITVFNSDYTGWGQSSVITLPQTGDYLVRVQANNDYQGEYRIRLTIARPPLQLENEANNSIATANSINFVPATNHLLATLAGYINVADGTGDYFNLGNLLGGAALKFGLKEPASSGFAEVLWIYNSAGVLMTNSPAGATNFVFTVPLGQDGVYYVRVTGSSGGFTGNPETALRFSGGSDSVDFGNWFNYQTFTLSMWVNPGASQNAYADILDNNHRAGINWVIEQNNNTANQYDWGPGDNGGDVLFNLAPNVWQHLAITRDATNVSRVYVNGTLVGTAAGSSQINYDGSQFLRIAHWGAGGRYWNGTMDEFRIWNRALSPSEIIAGMTGSLTGNEPNLVGYWRFNEGVGTNAFDSSPSNHVGILVNSPTWAFLSPSNAVPQGLQAQYILSVDLTNPAPPTITSVTLPSDGSTSTNIITSFAVGFSEDMNPAFNRLSRNIYRYNGHSYLLTDFATSWTNAEAIAVSLGGHLAAVNNAAENAWLNQTFGGNGDLWIGMNDFALKGAYVWSTGESLAYTNFSGGEPNNSGGNEDAVKMYGSGGQWADITGTTSLRGIIEVPGATDTDGDGLVDSLDPYPADALNALDLRASGPDGLFDTADDLVYHIYTTGYSSGLSAPFTIIDGPLQPGNYRFKVTTSLSDRFGNPLAAPYVRFFSVAPVSGFIIESRRNSSGASSTSFSLNPTNLLDGSFSYGNNYSTPANPYFITSGYLNNDTNLDLVTCNINAGNITVFLGDGAGNFTAATNVPTGSGPISAVIADFNGDNKMDIAVANYYSGTVSILLGNGNGGFQVFTNYTGFVNPENLAVADFNHDNKMDLVVPNIGGTTVTVLYGNGDGSFHGVTNYTVGSQPQTVVVGDINGDNQSDLVVANYNSSTISVLLGSTNGNGTFQLITNLPASGNTRSVALGDVNGDNQLDIVAISSNGRLNVFFGNGDGTFQPRVDYNLGSGDAYQIILADINGDGRLDALAASYGNSRLYTSLNNGDGTFGPPMGYNPGGNPISVTVGDFNHDGRLDLATANYGGSYLSVFLGNDTETVASDPAGTGLRISAVRGNLADGGDLDYWTFSAQGGDLLAMAVESSPANVTAASLLYRIYNPDGTQLTTLTSDGNGRGQVNAVIPAPGTYTIRVEPNNQYYGEYRLRLTLARPPVQLESEDNGSVPVANALTLTLNAGKQTATVLGYLGLTDPTGDFFQLGNLADGTQITLSFSRPASSLVYPQLEIYNSASLLVTNNHPGQTNLTFVIGAGGGGPYYAHVTWAYPSRSPAVTNALSFNGANNYVNVGNWSPGTKWSVQAWVMPSSLPGGRHTIAGAFGACQDWGIVMQNGQFGIGIRPPGTCSGTVASLATATPGVWYHVASVSDGTNASLYVNGVLMASGPVDLAYVPTAGGTWIGGDACCGEYFPGLIQDVSIWNRALSSTEVNNFMAASPTGGESGLVGYWRLQDGVGATVPDLSPSGHTGTLVNGPSWLNLAPVGSVPNGIFEQYLLNVSLLNTIPPHIISVNLPAEGTASSNIVDRFSVVFSEDMNTSTITNSANYELRGAGLDNAFGTGDDQLYPVLNSPAYTAGTNASYLVSNGPLQPGLYRLTISTNLADRTGNNLTNAYVRNFAVTNVPGFVLESRTNNAWNLGTSLSPFNTNRADGSFLGLNPVGVGGSPYYLATGRVNGDTNLDLVVANYGDGTISILLGDGTGGFQLKTNVSSPNNALCPVLGFFNSDSNLDLAVANYNSANVSIFSGNGDGNFQKITNYTVGSQPHFLAKGDFDRDGKLDLVTANTTSGNVSVLLGNGDGTFKPAVNYQVGTSPIMVAVGDVNGDGKPDLVTANQDSDNVSLLLGNGDGSFAPAVSIASGRTPRAIAFANLNNDTNLDLIVFNASDNTLSIMFGNGDGSFQPRTIIPAGTSDGYQIATGDFNGDGLTDIAVSGYGNNLISVFLNQGNGSFEPRALYGTGYNAVGLAAGDFNNDGRLDLAVSDYNSSAISVFLGNTAKPLAFDPPLAGMRMAAGRGNISDNNDADYFNFTAQAGDILQFAVDMPGNFAGSGQNFIIYRPDGSTLGNTADYYGRGQINASLTQSGTYTIRVEPYYTYNGEYRFRVTLAQPPLQVESESNDSVGAANILTFASNAGHRTAGVLGYLGTADTSGDFFALGNLSAGAVVNLNYTQPNSSPLIGVLGIYNSAGSPVTNSPAGTTGLVYTVTAPDSYYARITAGNSSAGLFSVYVLNLDVNDTTPPVIGSVTLPADGSTNFNILDRFTLAFNKDLDPSINALNRYTRLYNGHAYTITDTGGTWYNAELQARSLGGHLTAVNDSLENAWLNANFSSFGNVWIGLTDEAQKGTYTWAGNDPLSFTNWAPGQPNNSGNQDYVAILSNGTWNDYAASANYRGIVEVGGTDTDGDGIPDALDPYPYDPFNVFDLRAAGPDGIFDTADDVVYHTTRDNYTTGLSLNFYVSDGPLQPGKYRFMVTSSLQDRFGNSLSTPFTRYFTVANLPGYAIEGRTNTTLATATPLTLLEDPPGIISAAGRGKLFDGNDVDYWTFTGTTGEVFTLGVDVPGNPYASGLHYEIFRPNGTLLTELYATYSGGYGQVGPVTLPTNGVYAVRVSPYYGYYNEYRFRITKVTPPTQMESEDNGTLANANPITMNVSSNAASASIAGYVFNTTDLDYFNLGTVSNGYSIFLNVRMPAGSTLSPIVSVYNSAGVFQNEAPGGRATDGVAEVRVTQTGTYYCVVRSGQGSGGLDSQYVLDVQVVPTGSVNFPNLVAASVTPPSGSGIISGQQITYTYTIQNIGSLATPVANWVDRAALSTDTTLGNADDIPLGFFPHNGILNPGDSYSVTNTFVLPDGISGDYYLIVFTDAGNAVNEFLFEGDNTTVSGSTFHISVAPYPDLRVENLAVTGPDVNHVFNITWNTANRGNATAPAGFQERLFVRNQTSGTILTNVEQPIAVSLAPNATLAHQASVTTTNGGVYQVQITTDAEDNIFEYDGTSHASAEANNTATAGFQIITYYNVSVQSSPAGSGVLTGGGSYSSGSAVNATAAPNTNTLPYQFVNWTEGGAFQSANPNYSFIISRDRTLVANFTLPSFQISASNNPAAGGTVAGQGSFFYGTTNVLTANANFGYRFTNWTENGSLVAITPNLTNIVTSNRFFAANYVEANTLHVVTTASSPAGVATVAGAGSFTNGQSTTITAPLSVTNPPNIYNFQQFQLNGAFVGNNASFNKTFSTLDPTNMQFVAVYSTVSILPLLTNVVVGNPNPIPATTNFVIGFQFNRTMNTNFTPVIVLTNPVAAVQAVVPAGGTWSSSAVSNDTFTLPPITFSTGMDGTNTVIVSQARDLNGGQLATTNAAILVVDVTPPANPVISLTASNSSTATIAWTGYAAPADLNNFRIYLSTNSFNSVTGLAPVAALGSAGRSFTLSGLSLDRNYYTAVAAVDNAGNSSPQVTTLPFILPSSVPPPVPVQVGAVGPASALVSWNSYDTSSLLGFAGFKLYYETSDFTSVAGLTVKQTFGPGTRSIQIDNLDRTRTYHFAIVGYNGNGTFNANVTTAPWSDPYAGNIGVNTTIGGGAQNVVDILQSITVVGNAVLTIQPGTTLRFAPGTSLTVQQGRITANGTPLDPIILTSANDQPGFTPAIADWNGVTLGNGAGASLLRNVFIKYGAGLVISNCSPVVDAFTALYNAPAGLNLISGATLATTNTLLSFNGVGAQQLGSSQLTIINSDIKNNGTNALAAGGPALLAVSNWWGTAVSTDIDASIQGSVIHTNFLISEPLLTPAVGTSNNVTQVGGTNINLRLACRTADSMRLSEDSTFSGVFFSPFTNSAPFQLSAGGGLKTIFAQFRSITGQTSAPVSVAVTYITAGPTISGFNLSEGQVLNRPLIVTGGATAPLGMSSMEFYVDGIGQGTNGGGSFSFWFDVRGFSTAIHRVQLIARDNSGNFATVGVNISIAPTPPPAPVITQPSGDLVLNTNMVFINGTAEPFIQVRLFRSGALLGTTNAQANGTFDFSAQPLLEGTNVFSAIASDALGGAPSAIRNVTLDTLPPAQLIFDAPTYRPGIGVTLTWHFPATGKHAGTYQVFWSTSPIANVNQATGNSLVLNSQNTTIQGLATANYYFYVVGYDAIGNVSPLSAPVQFFYDAVPPAFNISFDKSSPVSAGLLHVVLSASKALNGLPSMTVQPYGSSPALLGLTNTALNTYEGNINVTTLLPSGPVQLNVSAADMSGNTFNGAPSGPPLIIDVTPPSGVITTAPLAPIQATNTTSVAVNLVLSEPAKAGTTPVLSFGPPTGAPVPVTLTGATTNWSGSFNATPAMGSGIGHFTLTVSDALDNVGHSINSGSSLELYNTALPTPPGQPVGFEAVSKSGGQVQLTWLPVANAEIYRVYAEPGTNFVTPVVLVADNITSNNYVDLPAADGYYRYVVTASRKGSEGTNSIVRVVLSDRTPPPTPTNVAVQLVASGLQITWQAGAGQPADHFNIYRNGALIRTIGTASPVIDNPPRGIMSYTVSAADSLGNEALSTPVTFQLLVSAVDNLQALVNIGQAPQLSWTIADPTAVGFNIYRNGIKQNSALLPAPNFTDSLPAGAAVVNYSVTAVNSTNAESAARSVNVYGVDLSVLVNSLGGGTNNPPITAYFDDYIINVSNLTAAAALPLRQVEVLRHIPGTPDLDVVNPVNGSVTPGGVFSADLAIPGSSNTVAQAVTIRADQETDAQGSSVIYQKVTSFPTVQTPGVMLDLSANQLPLAGGLTPFNVRVYNRGYAPMYLATTRGSGSQPGDLYISVKNAQGQEVSRTLFNGSPAGILFSDGVGYVTIPPRSSTTLVVPNVLVPLALASNTVTFEAVASAIYDRATAAGQQQSGPLSGTMQSSLAQTAYYGTAHTDFALYSNDQPVIITGQALDTLTGLPVTNVVLKIGFATRGYVWYNNVTTDTNGNYSYTFTPAQGLSGSLMIWAAHPDVFDKLNQAQITIYRIYASPPAGDIRMSKNDSLQFSIGLINPGDQPLTGFTVAFQGYQMQGTNQVPISTLHGIGQFPAGLTMAPGAHQTIALQISADANAPDNAIGVFTITSAEGASATFTGNATLLPAIPIITVVQPDIGYVEVSVDRGNLLSRQVTIVNKGLKDLQGVSILPPTNVNWMIVNLPASPNGQIQLPDIGVGQSNTFTVVFAPPTNTALAFYQDKLTVVGTNALATFDVNLYAKVTSSFVGAAQFYVEDILGLPVPSATVRLRNTALQVELPPVQTDINGLVTVTNLQEGDWSWQLSAPGHSANVGVVTIIPDQTVQVGTPETRLSKSLVTVNFSVVPVPFTDRYEITIEQTFETHVTAPVLVLDPTYLNFDQVQPGFEANFIVTAHNHGLIAIHDVKITGSDINGGRLTPLIEYLPILLPEQSVEIPFHVTYGSPGSGPQSQSARQGDDPCAPGFNAADCLTGNLIQTACGLMGLNAIAAGSFSCYANPAELIGIAQGLLVALTFYYAVLSPVNALVNAFGCLVQGIASLFAGAGGGGGGGSGPGPSTVGNFQGNGNGCFAAETRVLLADGRFKTIDQIKVGDVVKTGTGRYSVATVAETYTRVSSAGRELHFKSPGQSEFDGVRTTDEHFFWVDGRGWTQASGLKPGSWLFNDKGQRVQLTSSEHIKESLPVYTLKLHGDVAFYANGILVHDLCGTWTPEGPVFTNSPSGGHTTYQILK